MPMSTYKKNENENLSFINVYDKGNQKLKLTYAAVVILFLVSILFPATNDYIPLIQEGNKLKGIDNLYDYIFPLIAMFIISYVFFNDYQDETYEIFTFYSNRTFNFVLLKRWLTYIIPLSLGSFFTGMFYFRNVSFLDLDSLILSLRFTPNILFLSALFICITVYAKNSFAGLFVVLIYFLVDFLSDARIFKIFSLGSNSNNFFYSYSPEYYILNRLILLILSLIFLFLACKRSVKL